MSEAVIGDRSIEALLAELARINPKGDAGLTVAEMAGRSGISGKSIQALLQRAKDQGRLIVGKRPYERIDGRPTMVPVYRILPTQAKRGRRSR